MRSATGVCARSIGPEQAQNNMIRRHNFQTLSWFFDLFQRNLLELDPPYQRRSVWNQSFKDYFVETVLLMYPSPAIFLYESINEQGRSEYHVVDGKQRLTTLFDFVSDRFPVADNSKISRLKSKYFSRLDPTDKKNFWSYQFLVEYIPTTDDSTIDEMFDRLNRNVAKLTPQELRHARFDGEFMKSAEELSSWMESELPKKFPQIAAQSRRQMKDVEFASLLMLFIEEGPKGYTQSDLDKAYSDRDDDWEQRVEVEARFRRAIGFIKSIIEGESRLIGSRLRNQADFYSLVAAIVSLNDAGMLPNPSTARDRLLQFIVRVENENERRSDEKLSQYYEAARSASNDRGPRETRIAYVKHVLTS